MAAKAKNRPRSGAWDGKTGTLVLVFADPYELWGRKADSSGGIEPKVLGRLLASRLLAAGNFAQNPGNRHFASAGDVLKK